MEGNPGGEICIYNIRQQSGYIYRKSANHTNVNILGIAISKSALILKANVGESCIKGQIEIHAASPSPVYHLACNNLPPTSTICLHIPLDINIMYISQL